MMEADSSSILEGQFGDWLRTTSLRGSLKQKGRVGRDGSIGKSDHQCSVQEEQRIEGEGVEEHQKISWDEGEQEKGGMSERATEARKIKSNTEKGKDGPIKRNYLISCSPRIMVWGCQREESCSQA